MIDKFCKWGKKLLKENWITFKRVDFYLRNFFELIVEPIIVLERLSLARMNFEMETFELNNENWIQVDFWIWSLYLNFIFTILKNEL